MLYATDSIWSQKVQYRYNNISYILTVCSHFDGQPGSAEN